MGVTFFKRYRMHYDLRAAAPPCGLPLVCDSGGRWRPADVDDWAYELVGWDETKQDSLIREHAEAKVQSFRHEMDSVVFSCLGEPNGCVRLMREIAMRSTFLPEATWLIRHRSSGANCGTIQALLDQYGHGSIQNVGVVRQHRARGWGEYCWQCPCTACDIEVCRPRRSKSPHKTPGRFGCTPAAGS